MRAMPVTSRFAVIIFCVLVFTAAARDPAERDDRERQAGETLTGCLEKGDQPNTFTLTNASRKDGAKLGNVRLVAPPKGANLEEHLGHQVEVEGKPGDTQTSEELAVGVETGERRKSEQTKTDRGFELKAIRHLAASCS